MSVAIRQIRIEGDVAYVPLTRGYEAIIDAADVHKVAGKLWNVAVEKRRDGSIKNLYARHSQCAPGRPQKTVLMHRLLANAPEGALVDHADGNGLNNRSSNLRIADLVQNARNARRRLDNTSGYKGVTWHCQRQKWKAQIWRDGKQRSLGLFATPEMAAEAYAAASAAYHGEFGRVA